MLQISVIIPVYNDATGLCDTVLSLLHQDYPASHYEIIIVDNGSTDGTLAAAHDLKAAYPELVTVLEEREVQSSYAARNKGIAFSSGDLLSFLDADMLAPPTYLTDVNARFSSGEVQYLGCAVTVTGDGKTMAAAYNQVQGFPMDDYMNQLHFAGAGCLSVRRSVLDEVGEFDSRLESSGDREFGERVYEAGYHQEFAGDIHLTHPARATYGELLAKSRRLGRGRAQLEYYFPERFQSRTGFSRRLAAYLPYRPTGIRRRYAAAGRRIGTGRALLLSIWSLPLKVARPLARKKELRRLRRQENDPTSPS